MNKSIIILLCICTMMLMASANEIPNGEPSTNSVILSQIKHPKPHFADIDEPVAMYNTVTEELSVTLDAVHYSDYTITLVSGLIEVDYYPFSPLVCLPTASMGDVVTIYIESDDCGSWYGEIDKAEFGGPISN